ncbi:MAG: hypothetical protein OEZ43_09600 [Gammaproteobacteria bacterium]|nr:hypothetical protein [Gammaproteobacteria bacterium]
MQEKEIIYDGEQKPEISTAGIVYGDTIYWITIVATIIVIVGSVLSFITKANYIDPGYMLTSIWEGKTVEQIWQGAVGSTPDGHWYMGHIATGDGLTMFGIALGVFSVIPAIFGAGVFLFKEKENLFAVLAVIAAFITIGAMF